MPSRPWSIIGTDIFEWQNQSYLILVYSYSGWFEIDLLRDTSTRTMTRKMKAQFARYGLPDMVISDSGPQYTSTEF